MAGIYYRFQLVGAKDPIAKSKAFLHDLETEAKALVVETADKMIREDMAAAIDTWKHKSSIQFEKRMRLSASSITVSISTDDPVFNFIEGGTGIRYATMTRGFRAKTTPGVLGSVAGSGGLHYIDKAVPRDGIEARDFYEVSAKKQRAAFISKMQKIYIKNLKRFGLR